MKIKTTVTEIECSAEELRQSGTVADGFLNILRNALNGPVTYNGSEDEGEEDNE